MKRALIAFIILCIILTFCIIDAEYMRTTGEKMLSMMDELYILCQKGNLDNIAKLADDIDNYWEKCKPFYSVLNHHEELEQADSGIKTICEYALIGDTEPLRAELAATRSVIENIINMHIISFENVF